MTRVRILAECRSASVQPYTERTFMPGEELEIGADRRQLVDRLRNRLRVRRAGGDDASLADRPDKSGPTSLRLVEEPSSKDGVRVVEDLTSQLGRSPGDHA